VKILLSITLLTLTCAAHASNSCIELVNKPSKSTLAPGAVLKLKSNLKKIRLNAGSFGSEPTEFIFAYRDFFVSTVVSTGPDRIVLGSNSIVNVLSKVRKKDGITFVEVEIPQSRFRGVMYWWDLYNNTFEISEPVQTELGK
jgi:hypothetical protein